MFKKLVSLHGLKDYLSTESRRSVGKHIAQDGFAAGGEKSVGRQGGTIVIPGSPATVAEFSDFLASDTGGQFNGWARVNGDVDTGASSSVARQSMTNGVMRISFQGTPLNVPSTGTIGLTKGLIKNWKPDAGRLQFAARVKLPSLASLNCFIGFSDSGGSEQPAYDTGGGIITPAADAIGFQYSNLGSITAWTAVSARSVAADSGDQSATTGVTPTANTYDVLEIRMGDSGEYADFFVNGAHTNRFNNPVEAKTALTPGVWVFGSDTGTIQVDVDYIGVSGARDTGT
jgi:hypothetical protein